MAKSLNYQTIELYGVKLTLGYTVSGQRYIPATRETPEENLEATIRTITAYDSFVDLTPLLEAYIEEIYELLNDKI